MYNTTVRIWNNIFTRCGVSALLHLLFQFYVVNVPHIFSMQPPNFIPTHNFLWPNEEMEVIISSN